MGEVSRMEEGHALKQAALNRVGGAISQLAGAGALLLMAREGAPPEAQELIDALRDDITTMLGDVEALRDVIKGK